MPRSPIAGSRLPITQTLGLVADRDEAADALLFARFVEDAREDQMEPRHAAAGDPVLLAVDDKAVAAPVGARRHLAGGAAGTGSVMQIAGLSPASTSGGEPLLRFAAVFHDGRDRAHVGLDDDAAVTPQHCAISSMTRTASR